MNVTAAPVVRPQVVSSQTWHRAAVVLLALALSAVVVSVIVYGGDYYRLPPSGRVFHPKHSELRPSGRIGLRLGIAGLVSFVAIYLYAARKRVKAMNKLGKTRNWLDFHIVLGIAAPVLITLHSSFKMNGLAGIAYWIMIAVMLSGIIGRYLYSQIPRSISATELSVQELQESTDLLAAELHSQQLFTPEELAPVLAVPAREQVDRMSIAQALVLMLQYDLARPFHLARIRRRHMSIGERLGSLGGLLHFQDSEVEKVISLVRARSWMITKLCFLSKTQQIFHLWHVVHRPFSYSFAVLAVVHIAVVALMGYF